MTQAARRRMRTILRAAILGTVTALVVTGCSDGHLDVRSSPSDSWSSYGGDTANTNASPARPASDLALAWSRDLGGSITAPLTLNNDGNVSVSARTGNGCNYFILDHSIGRKNFCKRMADGFWGNAATVDQFSQTYIGEPGRFLSFTDNGGIRWRYDLPGTPTSAKFVAPGRILVSTSHGVLAVLDSHRGEVVGAERRLWDAPPKDPADGLTDCRVGGGPGCAVSDPPAVDWRSQRIFLNFREQGAQTSQVRAIGYGDGDLADVWTSSLPGTVFGPPTVSADGRTVYALTRNGDLYALSAQDGQVRWKHALGPIDFGTMSVSPDGLIVPAGKLGGPLIVIRDAGEHAEEVVRRDDLHTRGLSAIAGGDRVWTLVEGSDDSTVELVEVVAKSGTTKQQVAVPGATGMTTGVAISATGNVAIATVAGSVYYFAPRS